MIVAKENIEAFIPQRQPIIMVDNLLSAVPLAFESNFYIAGNNIFLKNGVLQEAALIENIAQTCAASFTYLQKESGSEPRIGFIGGISRLELFELPLQGQTINTSVAVTYQLENIFVVKGESFCNGKRLLECELKIIIT